jgi:hypothetical protein
VKFTLAGGLVRVRAEIGGRRDTDFLRRRRAGDRWGRPAARVRRFGQARSTRRVRLGLVITFAFTLLVE